MTTSKLSTETPVFGEAARSGADAVSRFADGFICVDKPSGPSSFAAAKAVRRALGIKKAGHAGTLDPMASGLLVVAAGRCTRLLQYLTLEPKVYDFTVIFGKSTDTLDAEGEVTAENDIIPTEYELAGVLKKFKGVINQVPPAYSAIKINGVPAYRMARRGEAIEMKPRAVHIYSIEMRTYDADKKQASFTVSCSSGTYVRTLAADIASSANALGHVSALRRTRTGRFNLTGLSPVHVETGLSPVHVETGLSPVHVETGLSPVHVEGNCPVSGTLSLDVGVDDVRALHATPLQSGRTRNARPYDTRGFDVRIHKAVQPHGGRYGGRSPLSPKKEFDFKKEKDFDFDSGNYFITAQDAFDDSQKITVTEKQIAQISFGREITVDNNISSDISSDILIAFNGGGSLSAVLRRSAGDRYHPEKVFL